MKLTKEEEARRAGMTYALKIAKERGVDGLEQELKSRGALAAPIFLPQKEIDRFMQAVKTHTIGTITAMSTYVLRNKFGWGNRGKKGNMGRLDKFKFHMNDLADSVVRDYLTIDDICEDMEFDAKIDLWFKKNDGARNEK